MTEHEKESDANVYDAGGVGSQPRVNGPKKLKGGCEDIKSSNAMKGKIDPRSARNDVPPSRGGAAGEALSKILR